MDSSLFGAEKIELVLLNVFGELPSPQEIEVTTAAVMDFYLCGAVDADAQEPAERILHWEKDAARIWADFMVHIGIDLSKTDMHWWRFRALFNALPCESQSKHVMGLRALNLSTIEDPKQRASYEQQKRAVALDPIDYDALYDDVRERRTL